MKDSLPYSVLQLEHLRQRLDEFDVVHFHSGYIHLRVVAKDRVLLALKRAGPPVIGQLELTAERGPLLAVEAVGGDTFVRERRLKALGCEPA